MFSDKAYFEKKYRQLGCQQVEVLEHEKTSKQFHIGCSFTMKSDVPVPGFARKFIAEQNHVTQQDDWDLSKGTGHLNIRIKGMPVEVTADMQLVDDGPDACANEFVWKVRCSVPLIGSKIEKLLAEDIRTKSIRDVNITRSILEQY